MSDGLITLYDIPLQDRSAGTWSPNTFKARLALQVKGIPFETEWVEYPDIEPLCKRIGAKPTSKKPDGQDHYTLPVIRDPSTGRVVADSFAIAMYLDETYPNSVGPTLLPAHTHALQAVFVKWFDPNVAYMIAPPLIQHMNAGLAPRSEAYFRETREAMFGGMKLEEIAPVGSEKRSGFWKMLEGALGEVDAVLNRNGHDVKFVMGDMPSFADIAIVSVVLAVKVVGLPEDWENMESWHGGRWVRLAEDLQMYGGSNKE